MNYFLSFVFAGLVCAIAQVIYDKTKLTQGHVVVLFVFLGSLLSFLNIYDLLIDTFFSGAKVLIMNYGHMLYQSAKVGAKSNNFFNIFIEMMKSTSGIVSFAIVISICASFVKKVRP